MKSPLKLLFPGMKIFDLALASNTHPVFFSKKKSRYDEFLSLPTASELELIESGQSATEDDQYLNSLLERQTASYSNTSARFKLEKKTFEDQYAGIYFSRLKEMKPWILERAEKTWNAKSKKYFKDLFHAYPLLFRTKYSHL